MVLHKSWTNPRLLTTQHNTPTTYGCSPTWTNSQPTTFGTPTQLEASNRRLTTLMDVMMNHGFKYEK